VEMSFFGKFSLKSAVLTFTTMRASNLIQIC
jgi:hypothetical protein